MIVSGISMAMAQVFRCGLIFVLVSVAGMGSTQTYSVTAAAPDGGLELVANVYQGARRSEVETLATVQRGTSGLEATGLVVEAFGRNWREVGFGDIVGWIEADFLALEVYPSAPDNLECGGNEPFWSLTIDGASSALWDPETNITTTVPLSERLPAMGRRNLWSYRFETPGDNGELIGIVEYSRSCSDDMSDFTYDYSLVLLGLRPGHGPAQGCCTVPR